jgi:TonB family protein
MEPKFLAGTLVLLTHLVVLGILSSPVERARQYANRQPDSAAMIMTVVLDRDPDLDVVPMPEVHLDRIDVVADALTLLRFDDPEQGDISGVRGVASAPQLTASARALLEARRAEGPQGYSLTVVLTIEVSAAGVVDSAVVARGCGNPSADAQALQFVRTLAWVPGTVDHHAQSVRIQFPVTLIWPT